MHSFNQNGHALLPPSSSEQWLACSASIRLGMGIESQSSIYAEEGTKAHALAEAILLKKPWPLPSKEYSQEMINHVEGYVEYIRSVSDYETIMKIETQAPCTKDEALIPYLFGTADCALIDFPVLRIIDFKYGAGIAVKVEDNTQLMCYALSVYHSLPFSLKNGIKRAILCVYQPRCPHDTPIKEWEIDIRDLLYWEVNTLRPGAKQALLITNDPVAGSHCRWCRAAGVTCFAGMIGSEKFVEPNIDMAKAVEIMKFAENFDPMVKATYSFVLAQWESGVPVPGTKAVRGRKSRSWALDEKEVALKLKDIYADGNYYKTELLSPAQIEKVIPKADKEKLANLINVQEGAIKIVLEEDPRPAVEFGGITMDAVED